MNLAVLRAAIIAVTAYLCMTAPAQAFGGVIPDVPTGAHIRSRPVAHIASLAYNGGPVLHANRTHVIFWRPSGSGLAFEPGYESLVQLFLTQVAADSRKPTNVYGLSGQYHDSGGPAAYASTYGGAAVDSDHLPPNDCVEPFATGPGWSYCVQDSDLQLELRRAVAILHLPTTSEDIYFLVLPNGLGSCMGSGPTNCALGGAAPGSYCGYHSFTAEGLLYAVVPYNAIAGHCQSDNPRPNASAADPTISSLSHEHNEVVTDPLGDAWLDPGGNEDGDLCLTAFGPALGGTATSGWNEAIHGGHYWLQEEWSNEDGACVARDESDSIRFSGPRRPRTHAKLTFVAHAHDPDGSVVAYRWFFGDGGTGHGRVTKHRFHRRGVYRVVLRTTDSAGNWAFSAHTIRISH